MKKKDIFIGLAVALLLAIFSFLASSSPDGLERVAEDKNFISRVAGTFKAPITDYVFPGINHQILAASLAGITGVAIVFALGIAIGRLIRTK